MSDRYALSAELRRMGEESRADRIIEETDPAILRVLVAEAEHLTGYARRDGDGPLEVALPEHGFIREYVECYEPTTEAPRQYHVAMALALLSLTVGREAWIELAGRLFLNVYVLILGPSTQVRKSTALAYGTRTLRRAADSHPALFTEGWLLPTGTVSAEALILKLAQADRCLMPYDEFGRLLAGAKHKPYVAALKETLTEVYGGWTSGRLTRERGIEGGPCFLSLVAATTRVRFEEEITADDVASGFLGRFLVVYAHDSDKVLAFPPSPDPEAIDGMVRRLAEIRERVRGEIGVTDGARAAIEEWYAGYRVGLQSDEDADLALPIFFRLDGIVRKLAALFEIAAAPQPQIVISEQAARDAMGYADFVFGEIRRRLLDGVLGDFARKVSRILAAVRVRPGIGKSDLMKKTNIADPEFSKLTVLLADEGQIEVRPGQGRNKRGIAYLPAGAAEGE
jgi:Protein of unknown function (DUF3987)